MIVQMYITALGHNNHKKKYIYIYITKKCLCFKFLDTFQHTKIKKTLLCLTFVDTVQIHKLSVPFNIIMSALLNIAYLCHSRIPQILIYTSLDMCIYADNDISYVCFPPLVQFLICGKMCTPGDTSWPRSLKSIT